MAKLNGHELRAGLVGPSACGGSGPEWAKFPGFLESGKLFPWALFKPASRLEEEDRKIKWPRISRKFGGAESMPRFEPRVGKVPWRLIIGSNVFLVISASLRVLSKR